MDKDADTYEVIGAAMSVHRELGCGFLEQVYQRAMAVELSIRRIPYASEVPFPVHYRGRELPCVFRADLVCFNTVIVELKAIRNMSSLEEAQLLNYLKASGLTRGLLLNFGRRHLQVRRFVHGSVAGSPPVATSVILNTPHNRQSTDDTE